MIQITFLTALALLIGACQTSTKTAQKTVKVSSDPSLLTNTRQLTFSGKRAGEGYFDATGEQMIFQSERDSGNPFYQIYVMNLENQKIHRVSPGHGKTTCSWIFPNRKDVIYSSTHHDPQSKALQKSELESRQKGEQKRYAWDYDPQYEIYRDSINGGRPVNLTRTLGYDAEGSVSPDGQWIVFSSNRHAYSSSLSPEDKARLDKDPSYFLDLYIMDQNGKNVRRLTSSPGYDGGPFFSPDGESVVFRRFNAEGTVAEVYTLHLKSMEEKQITRLGVMSWAPFYHPSGDYIVFTSNLYGYSNFELFVVDVNGQKSPIRITESDGFDGLPVFTPNGEQLTWNRKLPNGESQIFIAEWNDKALREALGLPQRFPNLKQLQAEVSIEDAKKFVDFLAAPQLKGRATGSPEETLYSQKIAEYFQSLGLEPLRGSYHLEFPFSKGSRLGSENQLVVLDGHQTTLQLAQDWTPLSFSKSAALSAAEVVFVGYGLVAPASSDQEAYDSYYGTDVTDKWVLFLQYVPEDVEQKRREHFLRYSRLEHKILMARQRGARGVIVVNGPLSKTKSKLANFKQASSTDAGIVAVSVSSDTVKSWFKHSKRNLVDVQKQLDQGEFLAGFSLEKVRVSAEVNLIRERGLARNVYGLLRAPGAVKTLVIGAHGDHLGQGPSQSSLMSSSDKSDIHFGADDNASGVAGVLELAHHFKDKSKTIRPRHNILFAVWSGEELGNLGSQHFTKQLKKLGLSVSAYVNMDMIGRLTDKGQMRPLLVQGVGSSGDWRPLIEGLPKDIGISLSDDPYLPTDALAFYVAEIPVLSFFSGVHSDYHTPRDTADRLDYMGLQKTISFVGQVAEKLAWDGRIPKYVKIEPSTQDNRRGFRIFLGTIPDYASPDLKGVKLSGVIKGGPAEKAGLQSGDIILRLASYEIQNINDYVYSLETMKPGEPTTLVIQRGNETKELKITPQARE